MFVSSSSWRLRRKQVLEIYGFPGFHSGPLIFACNVHIPVTVISRMLTGKKHLLFTTCIGKRAHIWYGAVWYQRSEEWIIPAIRVQTKEPKPPTQALLKVMKAFKRIVSSLTEFQD